jgi:hypothetical protein
MHLALVNHPASMVVSRVETHNSKLVCIECLVHMTSLSVKHLASWCDLTSVSFSVVLGALGHLRLLSILTGHSVSNWNSGFMV